MDGSFPRLPGAQLAVSETGQTYGFISNGCLETELKSRALHLLKERKNEFVRYGKGSKYIDIVLPCGSGIDLYFDQALASNLIHQASELTKQRQPFTLYTNLETGVSELSQLRGIEQHNAKTELEGKLFSRVYRPAPKLVIYGDSHVVSAFVNFAKAANFEVEVASGEVTLDCWTAAVLLFHDHSVELPILKKLLKSKCFYIGAQGSVRTHEARVELLRSDGFSDEEIGRLNGPDGSYTQNQKPDGACCIYFCRDCILCPESKYPVLNGRYKFGVILLAAGLSSRMQGENKLLKAWRGKPLLSHSLKLIKQLNTEQTILVSGHITETLKQHFDLENITLIHNPKPETGMANSIALGVNALHPDLDGVFICLGDMPLIQTEDFQQLSSAFNLSTKKEICIPCYNKKPGHPVLFSKHFFPMLVNLKGDKGAREIINKHPENTVSVISKNPGILFDLDTRQDFDEGAP